MDSRQVLVVFIPKRYTSLVRNPLTQSITYRNKPMTNDELLSKTISWLRFPLIVGVVFIHTNLTKKGVIIQGVAHEIQDATYYYALTNFFSEVLARIAVPLFFIISGFLFFYHTDFDAQTYKRKLKSRARTLLIPYLIWNFMAFLYATIKYLPAFHSVFPGLVDYPFTLQNFFPEVFWAKTNSIECIRFYPLDGPFWYVRELMVMVIFTPVVYWLIKKVKWIPVLAFGVLWYIGILGEGNVPGACTVAMFFFSVGAYLSINKINPLTFLSKLQWLPLLYLVMAIADTVTKGASYNTHIHKMGILVGILSCFLLAANGLKSGRLNTNKFLSEGSFFVFAAHGLFVGDMWKVLFVIVKPSSAISYTIIYFLTAIITTALCLFVYRLLKRYLPRVAAVVTGGR